MYILLYVILAFLIGIWIGWYLARRQKSQATASQQDLQMRLAAAEAEVKRLQSKANETLDPPEPVYFKVDELEDIHGIGPVFARRLYEARVRTFADLAAQTPERIHDIISPKSWQAIDPAEWIAEARTILEQRSEDYPIENFG